MEKCVQNQGQWEIRLHIRFPPLSPVPLTQPQRDESRSPYRHLPSHVYDIRHLELLHIYDVSRCENNSVAARA